MYNLFISNDEDSWAGSAWEEDAGRCVNEYTDDAIIEKFGALDEEAIRRLRRLPCIFAYEAVRQKNPHFGVITDVQKRQGKVIVDYEIKPLPSFLTYEMLSEHSLDLDIGRWELNRTHWAVKDVNLSRELRAMGITLPEWANTMPRTVDVTSHIFDVGLSFPGPARGYVEQVASTLERLMGPNSYFYDNNYLAQLARPSLDTLLQDIYRNRSKLIIVFIGGDYQNRDWCGLEFRAIRELLLERAHDKIMYIRLDDGHVDGVFKTDGYIDARRYGPDEVAMLIAQRFEI